MATVVTTGGARSTRRTLVSAVRRRPLWRAVAGGGSSVPTAEAPPLAGPFAQVSVAVARQKATAAAAAATTGGADPSTAGGRWPQLPSSGWGTRAKAFLAAAVLVGNTLLTGCEPRQQSCEREPGPLRDSAGGCFPFYSCLLEQARVVRYSEERDSATITSSSGRNKPTGLAGLACVHCCGCPGAGGGTQNEDESFPVGAAIFPQDRRTLAREVTTDFYHHLLGCEKCPPETKDDLRRTFAEQQLLQSQRSLPHIEKSNESTAGTTRTTKTNPFGEPISKQERLFFKDVWYSMGHKDMKQ
ncbi:unnamed protein product [Pseudo-nitzschia multistriata]|uniref:Uncharacterized protein n=1 Tax=Pseudo-nitzschia multistriata TaxID=183589 RepID=A0A448ZQW2_9STRA|nr:unnamed protein product [Pseudo-nitzschia multistriata]